jgi:hypothetical protein
MEANSSLDQGVTFFEIGLLVHCMTDIPHDQRQEQNHGQRKRYYLVIRFTGECWAGG